MTRPLTLLFCLLAAYGQAQTNTDAYWNIPVASSQGQTVLKLSNTAIPEPSSSLNTILLQQNGGGNAALLQTLSGTQNLLSVAQSGGDVTNATLNGSSNSLIINQSGGGNSINLGLTGNSNRFMLTQDGGDVVNMTGIQKSNTRFELTQGSGSNSLTVDNTAFSVYPASQGIPNLRIEQSGGANVTIQAGKVIGN